MAPVTFTRKSNGQVRDATDINELQAAIEEIDALGTDFTGYGAAGSGNKTALVVAGANTTAAVKANADYVCDGTADEVQIQQAIDALGTTPNTYSIATTGGGAVKLIGQFNVAATITNTKDHVELSGVYGHTILNVVAGFVGTKVITFNRDAQTRCLQFCSIHDLFIHGHDLNNASAAAIDGFDLNVTRSRIDNLQPLHMTGNGVIYRGQPAGDNANSSIITRLHSYSNGARGFWAKDTATDNFMDHCHFHENASFGAHFQVSAWQIANMFCWGNQDYGAKLEGATARYQFSNCKWEQNAGGVHLSGSAGNGPSEIQFADCDFNSNGASSLGGAAGTFDDVAVDGANPVEFKDCRWNPAVYTGQRSRYGINLVTNALNGNVVVTGGYATDASFNSANFTNVTVSSILTIRELRGHTPIGVVALTASGSPMTITAVQYDQFIYLVGGTVSSVVKNSITLATATGGMYYLRAGESIVVTYSSAPTINRNKV